MPPVDRNNPKRAASSESQYSLMEFMRDFPNDAACLEWLWRTRFSSDGEHAECPKCGVERVFKRYQTKQRRHRGRIVERGQRSGGGETAPRTDSVFPLR